MSTPLRLTDVERYVILSQIRDEGDRFANPPRPPRRGSRAEARRAASLLRALKANEWDVQIRALAETARSELRSARAKDDQRPPTRREVEADAQFAVQQFLNGLDALAEPTVYAVEKADLEWLRDLFAQIDKDGGFVLAAADTIAPLRDKIDTAYERAQQPDAEKANGEPSAGLGVAS